MQQRGNTTVTRGSGGFSAGGSTLFPEEIVLLGDIEGKTLVHLQCNAGQDTLSIAAHLGAEVTGVDISDEAIDFATRLSRDSGILAVFVRSDIYDWFTHNNTQYDVAFASYGALPWLSDIRAWGKGVAGCLKPDGRLVLLEFHPAATMFDVDWSLKYDYMGGNVLMRASGLRLCGRPVAD
jgi:SAM-dependent methyltransferase